LVPEKNRASKFCQGFAAVLLGCLFWLLLPAPQHLFLKILQVGQCLDPTNAPEENATSIGLAAPPQQIF
jgi:hypothetical protein